MDFDINAEEEGPYEALYNAISCHSLDSMASGRSLDRDSMNKDSEAMGMKAAGVRPVRGLGPQKLEAAIATRLRWNVGSSELPSLLTKHGGVSQCDLCNLEVFIVCCGVAE